MALVLVAEHFHARWITLRRPPDRARNHYFGAARMDGGDRQAQQRGCFWIGKVKTTAQMLALVALLWHPNQLVSGIGVVALYIAAVLTFGQCFNT